MVVEQLIHSNSEQLKSLSENLLTGKKRLPGHTKPFKRKRIKTLVHIDRTTLGANTAPDLKFRYISLSDVDSGSVREGLPTIRFAESPSRARRVVRAGDVIVATVRPNLQSFAYMDESFAGCIASTGFSVLSPREENSGLFLFHTFFGAHLKSQIDALVVGSNYPAINSGDVGNLFIECPDPEEQRAIATVLEAARQEILKLMSIRLKYLAEQEALMQQLLTGKRRVKLDFAA